MPLYDYECRNCGHRVEVLHGVNGAGPTACEQCGGPMRKLLNTPAIVFKGSGWAKKDRSSSSSSKSADKATSSPSGESSSGSESGAKSDSGDTSSSTSDSKAEAKSTAKPAGSGTAGSPD